MSKPEVVYWMTDTESMVFDTKAEAAAYCEDDEPLALIRLSDHKAERAADKARIAELEAANAINMPGLLDDLDEALEEIALRGRHDDRGYQLLRAWYSKMRRVTRAVDAALSQQGKEGEHV